MEHTFSILHRQKLVHALPTFMNTCEGGSCGCIGDDAEEPDKFELAALAAMQAIDDIYYSPYHHSQQKAIYNVLIAEIQKKLKLIEYYE